MPNVPELIAPKASLLSEQMNQVKQRQQQDFVGTMQAVTKVNPDQYAQATQLERLSGVPADVLHRHRDKAAELQAARKYENIYSDYAKTARALADGNVAALAHDDIDNITRVEDAVSATKFNQQSWADRNLFNPAEKWWESRAQSSNASHATGLQSQLKVFDEIDRAASAGETPLGTVEQRQSAGAKGLIYLNAKPEERMQMRADLLKLQEDYSASVAEHEQAIQGFIPDPAGVRAQRLGGGASGTWDALTEDPAYLWRLGAESAPNMIESLAGGLVAGPAGAGVASFNMEKGAKRLDVLREAKVDLTDPRAFLQALQDDDLMAQADHRATMKGAGVGLLDVVSAGLAGKLLMPAKIGGKTISQTNRELVNLAIQFPVQGAGEAAGEATGQLLADGKIDGGEVLIEGLVGGGMSTLDVMTYGGDRVVTSISDGLRKSRNAKAGKAAIDQMVEAVEGGKLKGRDLETFKKVTAAQLKDSDIETVWIPAAKLQELNQSGITILPELLNQIPGLGDQFADAIVRGGSVQMKTSDYLAHLGGFNDQLGDFLRVQADGMSIDDLKGWEDTQVAQLEAMAAEMKQAADPKSIVYQDAMGQLLAAGWQQQDAAQVAGLRTAMITKLSKSTGLTVDDLMARDPLSIRKQAPEQLKKIPITELGLMLDRLRAGDIPKAGDMFGKSLMEQLVADGGLVDDGGELAALDADVGKVGRNRITRPDGKTLDHAAMWAWERGYFPGVDRADVGPDLIVNALRDEMAGKPRYSVAQENATLRDQSDALNALQDHLDQLGIDMSQLDNAQITEMLSGQQGEQAYSQDGTLKTDTAAFKAWFGDSRVIDAAGKPLVVYHGTTADFDVFENTRDIGYHFGTIDQASSTSIIGRGLSGQRIIPAYLTIKNPLRLVEDPRKWPADFVINKAVPPSALTAGEREDLSSKAAELLAAAQSKYKDDFSRKGEGKAPKWDAYWNTANTEALSGLRSLLEKKGFDGLVYKNEHEGSGKEDSYVAFRPEQIKSAIGNNGNYDPNDANILHQSGVGANLLFQGDKNGQGQLTLDLEGNYPVSDAGGRVAYRDDAPGTFGTRTSVVEEKQQKIGAGNIQGIADVANAMAYISNKAVEHFDALVTDANGKPLAIVGSFKGGIDSASVYPSVVAAEAFRIPGAAHIYFVHNHPSGKASLSKADRTLSENLDNTFEGSSITAHGIMAIGSDVNGAKSWENEDQYGVTASGKAVQSKETTTVPALERELTETGKLAAGVESPEAARNAAESLSGGGEGVILMDSQHVPVAFVPMIINDTAGIRNTERMDAMYRALSLSNAAAAIVVSNADSIKPVNLAAFLTNAEIRVLDVMTRDGKKWKSGAESGESFGGRKRFFQPDGGGMGSLDDNRGSITFGTRKDGVREFSINLGPKSDMSTVLHELGHYYLEVVGELVDEAKAGAELTADFAVIREWLGAEVGKPLTVDQHEQFARGFEKYLAEGKAPSIELQGAFARFKRWMVAIYKDLSRLNVELTDEVRGVFDRLLASQEDIDAAMQVNEAMPMFEDATKAGMTEAEWSAYQSYLTAMRDDAETDIERQIRAEETRRQSKWWNEQLNKIRKEVGEEVDLVPVYKAMKALRTGQLEGVAATFKLQSGEVNERYGKRVLQRLAFMHSKQGGVPMDIAASMVGFQSGDEMIKTILESPSRAAAIEQEAQQRMQERHGNKVTGEAADKAMAAVHNERRADVLRIELEALAKQGNRKNVTSQQILKEAAKRIMQQRKVREIAPHEYQRAEAKAGREAFTAAAKGDLESAYDAKQRQLLNFHLYREAVKAREQVAKITERMKGYNKTSRRQKIGKAGHDYLDQIDAVMEQYEFRTVSLRELDKRVSFGQWYNDQVAAGNDPYVPEFILNSMGKTNYKDLSLDQLQEMDEFTKHVEHLARFKNKLLANDRIATKEEATNMLVDGALANMEVMGRELIDKNARDVSEETRDYLRDGNSSLMKVEQVIDWLDGNKVDGNWTQVFWRPLAEAQHKRDDMNRAVTQRVNTAIKSWFDTIGKDAGKKIHIKSTNQPMTKNGVMAVALNQGNEGNKAKLLKGYGWDQQVVDEILGHMTKEDWQLVSDLWEIVGSLWPEIAAMEKQANGIAPLAVEHSPVETPFGVLSGGYWPLVYDTMSDAYANVLKDMGTLAPLSEQGLARASTPRGHTKARVDGFAAPIVLDVSVIGHHLAGVIHDLTHRLPLADARSLLTTPSVVSALNKTIGKPMTAQFRNMVDGIASDLAPGSQRGIGVIQRGMNILRSNQAVAWMGYSVTTAVNQLGGYAQGLEYFAQRGARKHYLKALAKFAANPIAQMEMARAMSGEMRNRDINLDQTLREATNQLIQVKDGKLILDAWKSVKGGRDAIVKYSFVPLQWMQRLVDVPVWMAAYELDGGALNHDIAVQAADKAVRLTQMAGGAKDLASVQHSDLLRFFLPVYGYASLLWNRNVDVARSGVQGIKQRNAKQVLVAFERFVYLNILPALLSAAIRGALPDDDDDEETWASWIAVNSILSVTNGIPLMRDVAAGAFSDFGYGGASQIGAGFGNLLKAGNASKAESIVTNMVSASGQLFGLPASQINRAVRTGFSFEDGEMEDSADAILRGILFGPPRD